MDEFERFLARVDPAGVIEETRARAEQASSRRRFLLVGAGGLGAFLAVRVGDARAVSANDVDILNYALGLEYLQASFYTEAERGHALSGNTARAARVVGAVERAHVAAFQKLLGKQAVKRPSFNFQGVTEDQRAFLKTAVAFEDLAVAAYKGQATKLQSKQVLAAAIGIHTVEARHAAWMRQLFGITPSVHAFDRAASRPQIERLVASTHFIAAAPRMKTKQQPKFTG